MAENISAIVSNPQLTNSQQTAGTVRTETESVTPETNDAGKLAAEFVELTSSQLEGLVDQLNEFMSQGQRSLSFSVDKSVNEVVVSVVDKETQELIRQIPSPEALKLKQHLDGVIGLLFSDQA